MSQEKDHEGMAAFTAEVLAMKGRYTDEWANRFKRTVYGCKIYINIYIGIVFKLPSKCGVYFTSARSPKKLWRATRIAGCLSQSWLSRRARRT